MISPSKRMNPVSVGTPRCVTVAPLPRPLTGIIVPMVTPLRDGDTLDEAGLERLVEHVLDGGVHALFILGTTGEGPSLSYRLRRELIERTCRQVNGRVPVLVGPEELLGQSVLLGGHGGVNGGANLYPQLYVRLYEAAWSHNLERVAALHHEVMRICGSLYSVGPSGSSYLRGLKCALSLLGICTDLLAEPFQPFDPHERRLIEQALQDLGLRNGQGGRACPSQD